MEGASELDMRSPLEGERENKRPVRFRIPLTTCGIQSLIFHVNAPPDRNAALHLKSDFKKLGQCKATISIIQ